MILKLVRRNIRQNLGRLLLTLFSILLGVAFVTGSFLLADSLRSIFNDIAQDAFAGTDAQVRAAENELASGFEEIRIPESAWERIKDLPEIGYGEAGLGVPEQVYTIDEDGDIRRSLGPPVFASSWGGDSPISPFTVLDGRAPSGREIVIDTVQAEAAGLSVGDTTSITSPIGVEEGYEIVGVVSFSVGGSYFNLFDLPTMQRLAGAEGQISSISLNAASGVSNGQLISAVEEALGFDPELDVVAGETLAQELSDDFGVFIDIFGYILLGFAVVVLFVSIFIIYNTFAILIGQRVRQFGLLRSIGATGQQLRKMVLIESLLIGVIASVLGLLGGIAVAWFLKRLFSTGGGSFPEGPLQFQPRTIIVGLLIGIVVTVGSALMPAFKASRIPALAALRDGNLAETSTRRRLITGLIVLVPGIIALAWGLFASVDGVGPRLTLIGVGAALSFVGVSLMSVLFASPVARFLGAPFEKFRGVRGRLARDNASRNPQRTAATATALMIGLALITGVLVLQDSLKASLSGILEDAVAADVFVFEEFQGLPFTAATVEKLEALPEISSAAGSIPLKARINDEVTGVTGFDVTTGTSVLNLDLQEGTYDLSETGVLLNQDESEEIGLGLGDVVTIEFEDGAVDDFTIEGIFADNTLMGGNAWVLDRSVTRQHSNDDQVGFVGATFAEGVDPEVAQAAATAAMAEFSQLDVQNNSEFKQTQSDQINQILIVIAGLLGLCIIVAFIGIVNTMALSVLERTREIGLLRAVGTTRKQLRSAIRYEAIIVSVFGSVLGVIMGLILGYAAVTAIPDSFVPTASVPWILVAVLVVIGALLGIVAALFPAYRASKLSVLDAISTG